jgi:hypothetical protein
MPPGRLDTNTGVSSEGSDARGSAVAPMEATRAVLRHRRQSARDGRSPVHRDPVRAHHAMLGQGLTVERHRLGEALEDRERGRQGARLGQPLDEPRRRAGVDRGGRRNGRRRGEREEPRRDAMDHRQLGGVSRDLGELHQHVEA